MYDANIYEIVSMYIDAVKTAGITGKPEISKPTAPRSATTWRNLTGFQGFGGPIGFNDNGDAIKAFYIVQGQNGAWESKVRGCSAEAGTSGLLRCSDTSAWPAWPAAPVSDGRTRRAACFCSRSSMD